MPNRYDQIKQPDSQPPPLLPEVTRRNSEYIIPKRYKSKILEEALKLNNKELIRQIREEIMEENRK